MYKRVRCRPAAIKALRGRILDIQEANQSINQEKAKSNDDEYENIATKKIKYDILTFELETRKQEAELKKQEAIAKQIENERKKWHVSGTSAIGVTVLGLLATYATHYLQERSSLLLEEKKFQYEIYKEAQKSKDIQITARILDFYIKAKLIDGVEGQFTAYLNEGKPEKIPVTTSIETFQPNAVNQNGPLTISSNYLTGEGVSYVLTPNHGLTIDSLKFIVVHSSHSSGLKSTVTWLSNPAAKASTHILIGRDGSIIQMLPFNTVAWHAGVSSWKGYKGLNKYSISIELINSGQLRKDDEGNYASSYGANIPQTEVEMIFDQAEKNETYWHKYTDLQLKKYLEVVSVIKSNYAIEDVVSHEAITDGRKKGEPGPAFPYL